MIEKITLAFTQSIVQTTTSSSSNLTPALLPIFSLLSCSPISYSRLSQDWILASTKDQVVVISYEGFLLQPSCRSLVEVCLYLDTEFAINQYHWRLIYIKGNHTHPLEVSTFSKVPPLLLFYVYAGFNDPSEP